MKLKYILLSILFSSGMFCFAQEGANPSQDLPQVFPVSPEAASLGQYGNIPVNLASGKINYTVPLYTIKVSDFELPIYLSYNYNGLVTEQDYPMTGLGWDLMAGGRITRQIRGKDDEFGNQSYKANEIIPFLQSVYEQGVPIDQFDANNLLEIYENVATRDYDAQQDKYVISAAGLSGSYVYDENGDVVFINHRNYKVDKVNNQITITADDGVKYYFDKYEMGTYAYKSSVDGESLLRDVPTSFLLTEIELTNNKGSINFEYSPTEGYGKRIFSESRAEESILGGIGDIEEDYVDHLMTRHKLEKITFPNGEVRFDISSGALDQGLAVQALNNISVWDDNKQIVKYDFTYNDSTKNRKALLEITKSNGALNLPWYSFEYFSFPNTLAPSENYKYQDPWGYYNGNSGSLLNIENRTIDYEKTRSGSLKKITYPTKGYSSICYEQNRVPVGATGISDFYSYSENKIVNGRAEGGQGFQKVIDTTFVIPSAQIIELNLSARMFLYDPNNPNVTPNVGLQGAEANIKIECLNCPPPSKVAEIYITGEDSEAECEPSSGCPENYSETHPVVYWNVPANATIRVTSNVDAPASREVQARYTIKYEELINETGDLYSYVGGVRVSTTEDCNINGDCRTTNYKYVMNDGLDSGILAGSPPVFTYVTTQYNPTENQTNFITNTSSNSMRDFSSYQGVPVLYARVESIAEDGGNGKEVFHYSVAGNNFSGFPYITINNDWKKGQLLKKEIYKSENNVFILEQETVNTFDEFYPYGEGRFSSKKAYGLAVGKHYYSNTNTTTEHFKHNFYLDYPKDYKLIKTITKNFLSGQVVENVVEYDYDDFYTQLKSTVSTDSRGQKIRTDLYYPYSITGTFHDTLIARNRIAETVFAETSLINANLTESILSKRKVLYQDFGNNIIDPEFIQISKSTEGLENRVQYHRYDNTGNLLEFSKTNGPSTCIIWGHNQKFPVAKIENADYEQIQALFNLDSNTDFDTGVGGLTSAQESTLRNGLANAMVSTYTYDPLVGVTKMTDPREYSIHYIYDDFNRLKEVRDDLDNLVTDYDYGYKSANE